MKKNILIKHFFIALIALFYSFSVKAQVPASPIVTPYVVACGSTTFNINATTPATGQQVKWYSDYYMQNLLSTGATYTGTATQSQTFYAATYDPTTGLQSPFPATAFVFVPKPPVVHAVAGVDPTTPCLGAINVAIDTTKDSVSTVDIGDTYVMQANPTTNYGTLNYMIVWASGATLCCGDISNPTGYVSYLYTKFDLSQIPPNVTILDANVTMTDNDAMALGGDGNIYSQFVSDDTWTETGINWNNKPATAPTMVNGINANYMYWVYGADFGFTGFPATGGTGSPVTTWKSGSGFSASGLVDTGIIAATQSEYAGDKILSLAMESSGYNTRWYTKEYTGNQAQIPHLNVFFGYNAFNSTFAWTGPNGFTSTQQNLTGLQQGTYTLVVTNVFGCSDTTTVNVTNAVTIAPTLPDTICAGSTRTFFGHEYNTSGTYTDTLTSSVGCDSIVSIALYVNPPIQSSIYDSICIGGSYAYNGNVYTVAGAYTNSFTTATACDSIVTLHIYIRPAGPAPQFTNPVAAYCQDSVGQPLSVNITPPLYWYNALQGGAALPSAPVPVTTVPGDFSWYVSDTDINGCETQRAQATVHIYATTDTPVVINPIYCDQGIAIPLQATGNDLLWYAQPQGGTASETPPTPTTGAPGDEYYYVTQTLNGCESPRATLDVHILPPPALPVPEVDEYCQNEIPQDLNVNGVDLLWYIADTGGVGTPSFPPLTSQITVKTPFYVSQTVNGCESDRAIVYVEPCCNLVLPNAFTPNGDTKNNLFHIIASNGEYKVETFSIYDRWGTEVYKGTSNSAAWDGTIGAKPADIGVYYYYILYTCGASPQMSKKGEITLIR